MKLKRTIEKIVSYAAYVTEPEEIFIFGSMVNGTANVFSDVDLLIISETALNKKVAAARIKNYATQLSLKTDVLIYSEPEFEKAINVPNSFVKAVHKSGIIVYKKNNINLET